jgi:hypothetical protein
MKKLNTISVMAIMAALFLSFSLSEQDQTTVTVKVEKNGEVVQDTTFQVEDEKQVQHALKMMEILGEDAGHVMKMHTHSGDKHKKVKVMVTDDEEGEWHVITHHDEEIEIKKHVEGIEGDEEEVEVIVIKKKCARSIHDAEEHEVHEYKKGEAPPKKK